jgi:hypothetical protein
MSATVQLPNGIGSLSHPAVDPIALARQMMPPPPVDDEEEGSEEE